MSKPARTVAVAAAICGVALLPVASSSGERVTDAKIKPKYGTYKGKVTSGGAGEVRLVHFKRQFPVVRVIQGGAAKATCADGTSYTITMRTGDMQRKGLKFSETITPEPGRSSKLSGKWVSNTKVKGTWKVVTLNSAGSSCATPTVKFTAKRTG